MLKYTKKVADECDMFDTGFNPATRVSMKLKKTVKSHNKNYIQV